ncbi:MAG: endonuclease/exonuclease/phosphatase family protein [Solirubrobacterales bacterium]|nr:endonuclease/exonuclease/phosphatase family protein [Solirubrobacterales bacterium]
MSAATDASGDRLRLITWNVARRRSRLVEQAAALAGREPSIVALQEVTRQTLSLWRHAFRLMGLEYVRSSLDSGRVSQIAAARRGSGVLLASRVPLNDVEHPLSVPWPEAALWAAAETTGGAVEVVCVHVPNAANGTVRPQTLRAIRHAVAGAGSGARVVCGDLNTPRRELPTGEVLSFARDRHGRLRPDRGLDWDAAELGVVPGLRDLGYRDAYRAVHGYESSDPSWTWQQIAGHGGGWRIDHIFASAHLQPVTCLYHHGWRECGLSDHSALEADLRRAHTAARPR